MMHINIYCTLQKDIAIADHQRNINVTNRKYKITIQKNPLNDSKAPTNDETFKTAAQELHQNDETCIQILQEKTSQQKEITNKRLIQVHTTKPTHNKKRTA